MTCWLLDIEAKESCSALEASGVAVGLGVSVCVICFRVLYHACTNVTLALQTYFICSQHKSIILALYFGLSHNGTSIDTLYQLTMKENFYVTPLSSPLWLMSQASSTLLAIKGIDLCASSCCLECCVLEVFTLC